ncbi:MAG: exo-alpha-sialidase [Hyphomonadaceae bacterium]|nr:exo-alpha-sialidase [Clostridia bacterium]
MKRIISWVILICMSSVFTLTTTRSTVDAAITTQAYRWSNVAIGGGGYVTGLIIHPKEPNLVYMRTDVGGIYRWDNTSFKWIQLMGWVTEAEKNLYGGESIALDPNEPNNLYTAAGKYGDWTPNDVLKSTDRGATWQRTNLNVKMNANGDGKAAGERLAVDPNKSSIIYFASRLDGLWKSTSSANSGTWSKVSAFPITGQIDTNKIGLTFVQFDNSSGTAGNASQKIYVGAWGRGVYTSTDGGSTWSLMSGSPVNPNRAVIAPDGTLYVSHSTGVKKFKNNTWTDITPSTAYSYEYCGITIDPTDPNILMTAVFRSSNGSHGMPVYRSTNGGTSWTKINMTKNQTVKWTPSWHFASATSTLTIDPHDPKRVWFADWYAVFRTEDITVNPSIWTNYEYGHEELVTVSNLISPPSGDVKLFSGFADVGGFEHLKVRTFPDTSYYSRGEIPDMITTGIDFQNTNPNFVVRVGTNGWTGPGKGGYSTDQGKTYSAFTSNPGSGGRVAVSANSERIVWAARGTTNTVKYSTDRGTTWQNSAGLPGTVAGSDTNIFKWNQPLAADKIDGNKFYAYASGKLYRSTDGAANFTAVNTTLPDYWESKIATAPDMNGEVWGAFDTSGLYRSSDSGQTFTKFANVQRAHMIAFGKNAAGKSNPTVFVYGTIDNTIGIFRSDDMGTNWVRVNVSNSTAGNDPNCMGADRQIFGRVYIGTNGSGILFGEPVTTPEESPPPITTPPPAPTINPVAYWKFDENTGATVADSAGNGLTGNSTRAAWDTGRLNSGLKFDNANAANSYVKDTTTYMGTSGTTDTNYDYKGLIDEVKVYNTSLSAQQIRDLYNKIQNPVLKVFSLPMQIGQTDVNPINKTVQVKVPIHTDVRSLVPKVIPELFCKIFPENGTTINFSKPVPYTAWDEQGNEESWLATVAFETTSGVDVGILDVGIFEPYAKIGDDVHLSATLINLGNTAIDPTKILRGKWYINGVAEEVATCAPLGSELQPGKRYKAKSLSTFKLTQDNLNLSFVLDSGDMLSVADANSSNNALESLVSTAPIIAMNQTTGSSNHGLFTVSGTVNKACKVFINYKEVPLSPLLSYETVVTLNQGQNNIRAEAVDAKGARSAPVILQVSNNTFSVGTPEIFDLSGTSVIILNPTAMDILNTGLKVINNTDENRNTTLIVALYHADGRLVSCVRANATILSGEKEELNTVLEFPNEVQPQDYIKVFVWGDTTTLTPLLQAIKR